MSQKLFQLPLAINECNKNKAKRTQRKNMKNSHYLISMPINTAHKHIVHKHNERCDDSVSNSIKYIIIKIKTKSKKNHKTKRRTERKNF